MRHSGAHPAAGSALGNLVRYNPAETDQRLNSNRQSPQFDKARAVNASSSMTKTIGSAVLARSCGDLNARSRCTLLMRWQSELKRRTRTGIVGGRHPTLAKRIYTHSGIKQLGPGPASPQSQGLRTILTKRNSTRSRFQIRRSGSTRASGSPRHPCTRRQSEPAMDPSQSLARTRKRRATRVNSRGTPCCRLDRVFARSLRACATARQSSLLVGVRSVGAGPCLAVGTTTDLFFAGFEATSEVASTHSEPKAARRWSVFAKRESCGTFVTLKSGRLRQL